MGPIGSLKRRLAIGVGYTIQLLRGGFPLWGFFIAAKFSNYVHSSSKVAAMKTIVLCACE
jgi:hypothetical protein